MIIFERYQDLFIPEPVKLTKKYIAQLEKDAIKWLLDNKIGNYNYKGGYLIFHIESFRGGYIYPIVVIAIHLEHFKDPCYLEGWDCYQTKDKGTRKQTPNPYSKVDFYRHTAFKIGYSMSISNSKYYLTR